MARDESLFMGVLHAAEALLEARENQMVTIEEWDALTQAVVDATRPSSNFRDEAFAIEDDLLVRRVVPRPGRGEPYQQTCTKTVFDDVAYAIEQIGAGTFTDEDIRAEIDAPSTQVVVVMAFLKERGSIVPAHQRKHRAATDYTYEDALIEWHALREKPEEATS